jgi:hypothetical protein
MADIRKEFGWVNQYGDEGGKKGILDSQADVEAMVKAWATGKIPDQQVTAMLAKLHPTMRQQIVERLNSPANKKNFVAPGSAWERMGYPTTTRHAQMLQMLQS